VLYTGTSNGVGGDLGSNMIGKHAYVVNPEAPAFIALDKNTGRLLARENAGLSSRLWHCQWSSPSLGEVGGKTLVFLGGGDGFCYAFEALAECPETPVDLKLVWSYDCNPPEYRRPGGKPVGYYDGDRRKKDSPNRNDGKYLGPSQVIATPVFHRNRVYVAIGQDPAHGRGRGMLHCIDATQSGDITQPGCVWKNDAIERTIATAAVHEGLVYLPDLAGKLHCLDADTGDSHWVYDTKGETWGGTLVADGKLFLGNQRYFYILAAGKEAKLLAEIRLGSPAYSTPIAAGGTLYVSSQHFIWAVRREP
jgi:outer membrane protein assembly factor BamB